MARGDYNLARVNIEEELIISEELGLRMDALWSRAHLGYLALAEGNINEAREHFASTAQTFHEDQNQIGVVFSLEGMARLYTAVDKPHLAARLVGWADASRETVDESRPLLEQAEVKQTISACLARLGKAAYSEAYHAGRKMSMAEALALALESA